MLAGPAIALLVAMQTAAPARADDFLQRITINFSPVYLFSTGDDDIGPPFPGQKALGYTKDNPTVGGVRFDYGAALKINAKTSISFSHSNVGYQLGRILTAAPNTSLVTGSIYDYTDTIALNYTVGNGLGVHGTYFDHQRSVVTGLCLNQKYCYDPTTGTEQSNPLSIDEHGYTVGFTFINYTNLPVLYRDSAVPEAYRGIIFGFSKVISKNLTLSYTNLNLQSCRCIARVPPPDNLRLAAGILSLNIHTGL
jgi:hypothetical protein